MNILIPMSGCALVVLAACAHRPAAPVAATAAGPTATPHRVDVVPRLLGCAGYNPPPVAQGGRNRVRVTFVVDSNGVVVPGTPRPVTNRFTAKGGNAVSTALRQALTCRYEPARHGDQPVAARATYDFYYYRTN